MASTYARITPNSNGNRKTWTFSAWVKRSNTGENNVIFSSGNSGNVEFLLRINDSDTITAYNYQFTTNTNLVTNRKFRDTSAWYHIVFTMDTTQATASNRAKLYINGVQETSLSASTYASQNEDLVLPQTNTFIDLGRRSSNGNQYFNGLMSHVHFCDGTAYDATAFGEYDANGVWKIKTSPSVTYGTYGFFILKDGNSVTDQSGNGNNLTVAGGTLTNTEDSPSNVFATFNPNDAYLPNTTLSNGNLTLTGGSQSVNYSMIRGNIGNLSGKYYWEVKAVDNAEIDQIGVMLTNLYVSNHASSGGLQSTAWGGKGVQLSNGYKVGDGSGSAYMGGFSANDILMVALDLDNTKITFGRNGQWSNGSGGADQTYANSTPAFTNLISGEFYLPAHAQRDSAGNNSGTSQYNFGNGYFGTTAVSSAGTNASGIGIFEYDVPTGYTALSTKGLNL